MRVVGDHGQRPGVEDLAQLLDGLPTLRARDGRADVRPRRLVGEEGLLLSELGSRRQGGRAVASGTARGDAASERAEAPSRPDGSHGAKRRGDGQRQNLGRRRGAAELTERVDGVSRGLSGGGGDAGQAGQAGRRADGQAEQTSRQTAGGESTASRASGMSWEVVVAGGGGRRKPGRARRVYIRGGTTGAAPAHLRTDGRAWTEAGMGGGPWQARPRRCVRQHPGGGGGHGGQRGSGARARRTDGIAAGGPPAASSEQRAQPQPNRELEVKLKLCTPEP